MKRPTVIGLPVIPLDVYRVCPVNIQQAFALIQMSLSLAFGKHSVTLPTPSFLKSTRLLVPSDLAVSVFVLAAIRRFKSQRGGAGAPSILDTINRDAKIYFGIITTNHVLIVVMYASARVGFTAPASEFNTN